MNNTGKLRKIKARFLTPENRSSTPDIYTFQESGSTEDIEGYWNRELPGKIVYSHGSRASCGVLLGVHPASPVSIKSSIQDLNGRFVIAECCMNEEIFTVASVYFEPNLPVNEYEEMLKKIAEEVEKLGHCRVVWMGDFNVALDPTIDSTSIK